MFDCDEEEEEASESMEGGGFLCSDDDDYDFSYVEEAPKKCKGVPKPNLPVGKANAARVSRGSKEDTWKGLSVKDAVRNDGEHVTVTCVIYFTVAGGVPSQTDVENAILDMENLYRSCGVKGKLSDAEFDAFKKELTVGDMAKIVEKVVTQPQL